jgi:F-type H+-transporting ATPase subunit delta
MQLGLGSEQWGSFSDELFGVTALVGHELPLRRVLADSAVEPQAKAALLENLLGARVSGTTLSFLTEVVALRWSRQIDLLDALETLAALASFEQAQVDGSLDRVEDELFRFGRILDDQAALRDALGDRNNSDDVKRQLLTGLLQDKVSGVTLRLAIGAATGYRRRSVTDSLQEFSRLAADFRDRLNARVTVAVAPTEAQLEQLSEELKQLYGKQIGLRIELDPQILGGLVIRVGDEVLDASIARRLDIARRSLAEHV